MGITKYSFNGNSLSAKQIVDYSKRKKQLKRSRKLGYSYIDCIVDFQWIKVKLFFCKTSHKGKWHGLLTTNLDLSIEQAYKIYATRWTIEVFFKENKQHLGLDKCRNYQTKHRRTYLVDNNRNNSSIGWFIRHRYGIVNGKNNHW